MPCRHRAGRNSFRRGTDACKVACFFVAAKRVRLPAEVIRMIKTKTALEKATDLLAHMEQSSTTLRRKLLARHYDAAEVDEAIDKLKRHGYLDDAETCRRQFEAFYAEGKLSVRQIVAKLIQRGFDKNFIEQLVPDDSDAHDLNAAIRLLQKKFPRDDLNRPKAWQFLSTRGFDGDTISEAIEDFPHDT